MRMFLMIIMATVVGAPAPAQAQARDLDAVRGRILDHAAQVEALHREKELLQLQNEIARLRKECLGRGFVCAVGGLRETVIAPEPASADAPASGPSSEAAPDAELRLVAIVGGRARIAHRGRAVREYREGALVAGWRLESIELDRVHLAHEHNRRTLHLTHEARRASRDKPES